MDWRHNLSQSVRAFFARYYFANGVLVEEDVRLIPGTVSISEERLGQLFITAETYEFGRLDELELRLNE